MRTYIRHPTSIPIQVCAGGDEDSRVRVRNLSAGGLCFVTDQPVKVGTIVEFDIPVTKPDYHGRGVIVWRREQSAKKIRSRCALYQRRRIFPHAYG